jgi:hypothetical protein
MSCLASRSRRSLSSGLAFFRYTGSRRQLMFVPKGGRPAALTRNGGPPVGSARGMRRAAGRLLDAGPCVRDLLLCAKYLFVAASTPTARSVCDYLGDRPGPRPRPPKAVKERPAALTRNGSGLGASD